MKVKINGVWLDLLGKDLYSYICECLINEEQLSYNYIFKHIKSHDRTRLISFIIDDTYILSKHQKKCILVSLLYSMNN